MIVAQAKLFLIISMENYGDSEGIIWMDPHPDIYTPKQLHNEHTMVLGNLLGDGSEEFAKIVKNKFSYNKVMYGGLIWRCLWLRKSIYN